MRTPTLLLSLTLLWGPDQSQVPSIPEPDPELQALVQEAREREAPIRDLLAVYRRMDGLGDVRIRMEGGVLELEGSALTPEDRTRAGELAERLTGAIYVDNRIEVERTLAKRLEPAVERFREKGTAFIQFLPVLTVGLLLLSLTILTAILIGRPRFPYEHLTPNVFAQSVLRQVARTVVALVGILLTLELLGATALVGAVLGTAGLFGLAIGFAFRDIAENYLAGILLSLRQPFAPMDHVELSGHEGKVVRLTGRETILMTLDGNHVRIPNTLVFKGILTNFTRNPRRRFQIQVGIAPEEDITRTLRVAKEAIEALPGILERPPVTGRILELAASSVELRFSGWVDQTSTDYGKVRSEATRTLKEALEREGVRTPPPEYGVRILDHTGDEDAPAPLPESRKAAAPPSAPPSEPASEPDVAPDTTIEEQIAEDLRKSGEENFLEGRPEEGPTPTPTDAPAREADRP
jgi:small conductance mechanosensitive channel